MQHPLRQHQRHHHCPRCDHRSFLHGGSSQRARPRASTRASTTSPRCLCRRAASWVGTWKLLGTRKGSPFKFQTLPATLASKHLLSLSTHQHACARLGPGVTTACARGRRRIAAPPRGPTPRAAAKTSARGSVRKPRFMQGGRGVLGPREWAPKGRPFVARVPFGVVQPHSLKITAGGRPVGLCVVCGRLGVWRRERGARAVHARRRQRPLDVHAVRRPAAQHNWVHEQQGQRRQLGNLLKCNGSSAGTSAHSACPSRF